MVDISYFSGQLILFEPHKQSKYKKKKDSLLEKQNATIKDNQIPEF